MGVLRGVAGYFAADITRRVVDSASQSFRDKKASRQNPGANLGQQQGQFNGSPYPQNQVNGSQQGVLDSNVLQGTDKPIEWTMPKVRQYFKSVREMVVLDEENIQLIQKLGYMPHICLTERGLWNNVSLEPHLLPNDEKQDFPFFYCPICNKVVVLPNRSF